MPSPGSPQKPGQPNTPSGAGGNSAAAGTSGVRFLAAGTSGVRMMGAGGAPIPEAGLDVDLAGLRIRNPILSAAGTFGYGTEYGAFVHPSELGAVVTKSITLRPRPGDPPYRAVETRAGLLTSHGMSNVGLDVFLQQKAPTLAGLGTPVIVSVAGEHPGEYAECCRRLDAASGVAGIELNLAVRPGQDTGEIAGDDAAVRMVVSAARGTVRRAKLLVKLSAMTGDIARTAAVAIEAGADVLTITAGLPAMAIDPETRRPLLGAVQGALSGPSIKPVALAAVHRVHRRVAKAAGIPIVGVGGVQFAGDAVEFLLAGATAVAIGTATLVDPQSALRVIAGLKQYLDRHRIPHVQQLIGALITG